MSAHLYLLGEEEVWKNCHCFFTSVTDGSDFSDYVFSQSCCILYSD